MRKDFVFYFHDCVLIRENCEDYICPAKICIPVMCYSNNELAQLLLSHCTLFIQYTVCKKEGKDSTQDTEPTPENDGEFELTTNPAYGEISYVKDDKSQNGGPHPVWDDDGGNVYVSTDGEPPAYENLNVLY